MAKVGRHKVTKKLVDEYPKVGLERLDLPVPNADADGGPVEYTISRPTSSRRSRTW